MSTTDPRNHCVQLLLDGLELEQPREHNCRPKHLRQLPDRQNPEPDVIEAAWRCTRCGNLAIRLRYPPRR